MNKKINLIDLDNTLLPYDSLTRFVWLFISDWRCSLPVLYYSILRVTGIINKGLFLKKVLITTRKTIQYESKVRQFGLSLFDDIRKQMLRFILENTDEFTVNVICTASPDDYVKYLCEKLDWKCISTTLDSTGEYFIHTSGKNKILALQKAYPEQEYTYNLAISDNRTDEELLRLFKKSYLIKNKLSRKELIFNP